MFKFATNKFSSSGQAAAGSSSNSTTITTNGAGTTSTNGGGGHLPGRLAHTLLNTSHKNHHGHGGHQSDDPRRTQIQSLFAHNKLADKGFPTKPSAMDYDRKLRLLAIGTKTGEIRIYGQPGTASQQFSTYGDIHPFPIQRILFVQGAHQLITVCERAYKNEQTGKTETQLFLVLWQIPKIQTSTTSTSTTTTTSFVEKVKEYQLEARVVHNSRLSALTLLNDNSHLFIGFETGDVYVFNVANFQLVPGVINKDYILKNIPAGFPANSTDANTAVLKRLTSLGAVESICHHPKQLPKLLIAYQRGLWIVFDFIKNQIDQINQTQQQLESAMFYQQGECVATSHSDGSFILWELSHQSPIPSGDATTTTTPPVDSTPASTTPTTTTHQPTTCTSFSTPNIVYGPFPCKAVSKCLLKTCRHEQPYVIFSGGCPRVNYSDKITITVAQGETHVCFEFTSRIIEFFTIDRPVSEKSTTTTATSSSQVYDNPQALFVLLEEEFVAIDLVSEGWPQYRLPYLCSVHSSAIICTHFVNGVSKELMDRLRSYGQLYQDAGEVFSERSWPIVSPTTAAVSKKDSDSLESTSNETSNDMLKYQDLLLTGHEDGSVRFWNVTGSSMKLIYKVKTADYFQTDSTPLDDQPLDSSNPMNGDSGDNWPPFRKVGTFDPYSDDPKLGIQKIYLCPLREILVIAGTAGQVLIMSLNEQARELPFSQIQPHKINIMNASPGVESHFVWKGHEPLLTRGVMSPGTQPTPTTGLLKLPPGYQLHALIQLYPPTTVSALALNTEWQLVGMGTANGFALYDYCHMKDLLIRCTLDPSMLPNPNDSGNGGISRRKSLKKSLRESFRKLRRGRSQKQPSGVNNKQATMRPGAGNPMAGQMQTMRLESGGVVTSDFDDMGEHRPIERQVESREFKPVDDIPPSVVRYMYFVRTYIINGQQQTNSLWVGTNTGMVHIYALQFLLNSSAVPSTPAQSQLQQSRTTLRANQSINCVLAREMRLKHRAPVVHIQVLDQNMQPLPYESTADETLANTLNTTSPTQAVTTTAAAATSGSAAALSHKLIICSEEQFKVFQLPSLKPVCKFKLTAVEGARVRRIGYTSFVSKSDARSVENCLACLTNLGEVSIYSLPQLKRHVQMQCMKQQDINAITSFVFSKLGQAYYLQSPSEFVHTSFSARDIPVVSQQQQQEVKQPESQLSKVKSSKSTSSSSSKKSSKESTPSTNTAAPPVPAPRTQLNNNNNNADSSIRNNKKETNTHKVDAKQQSQSGEVASTTNTNTNITTEVVQVTSSSVTGGGDVTSNNNKNTVEQSVNNESVIEESKVDKQTDSEETVKSSAATPAAAAAATLDSSILTNGHNQSALLNQSNISSSTLNNQNLPNGVHSLNSNNLSLIGDSLNSSVSVYNTNGSASNTTTTTSGNLSMDSVIDRFNEEFNEVSMKKIPSAIEEDVSGGGGDSLLFNESSSGISSDLQKTSLNGSSSNGHNKTNGNGHTTKQNGTNGVHSKNGGGSTNGHHKNGTNGNNGHVNNGHSISDDDDDDHHDDHDSQKVSKKSTSPLATKTTKNGKAENVTKKNGTNGGHKSSAEYKETEID